MDNITTRNPNPEPNVQDYLRFLPLMMLFGVLSIFKNALETYSAFNSELNNSPIDEFQLQLISLGENVLYAIFFWVLIAKLLNTPKSASIALLVSIIITVLPFCLEKIAKMPISEILRFCFSLLSILPFLGYALFEFKDKRILWVTLLGFAIIGRYKIAYSFYVVDYMKPFLIYPNLTSFFLNFHSIKIIVALFSFCANTILLLIPVTLMYFFKYFGGFRDRIIDFSNNYKTWQATFIILTCKLSIPIFAVSIGRSCGDIKKIIVELSSPENIAYENTNISLALNHSLIFFASLVLIYFTVWLLRKVLVEVLYQKGIIPSWNVWFLTIPFIGWLVFTFSLFENKVLGIKERVKCLNSTYEKNSRNRIATTVIITQIVLLLFDIRYFHWLELLPIIFFLFFVMAEVGMVAFTLVQCGLIFFTLCLKDLDTGDIQNHIVITCNFYLLYVIFHTIHFEYIPEEQIST